MVYFPAIGRSTFSVSNTPDSAPQERQRILNQFQQVSGDPRQPFTWDGPMQDSPEVLARMAGQARQQQPDLLGSLGGALSNPMAKMAMAGVAAYAAQRMMGDPRR